MIENGKDVHQFEEEVCTVCGYQQGEPLPTEPEEPQQEKPRESDDDITEPEKVNAPLWLLAVLVGIAAAGIGVLAALLIVKKKK